MGTPQPSETIAPGDNLERLFRSVRQQTRDLAAALSDADATVQSMPDASPAKWHLAHTSWFFEEMVLAGHTTDYHPFDERYGFLFNSYYESLGARHARPERGLLTRPTLADVNHYRDHVDEALRALLARSGDPAVRSLVELGCHHEQQHQELLLTDILNLFARNPLHPAYAAMRRQPRPVVPHYPSTYTRYQGGVVEIGHQGPDFAFDCETPRHREILPGYWLANRCITNREWLEFMADDGYRKPLLWL